MFMHTWQMVANGEAALAEEYRGLFGLPPSVLQVDPAELAAEQRRREEAHLQQEVPLELVVFVDTRCVCVHTKCSNMCSRHSSFRVVSEKVLEKDDSVAKV